MTDLAERFGEAAPERPCGCRGDEVRDRAGPGKLCRPLTPQPSAEPQTARETQMVVEEMDAVLRARAKELGVRVTPSAGERCEAIHCHGTSRCTKARGHDGDHQRDDIVTWPDNQSFVPTPSAGEELKRCQAQDENGGRCVLGTPHRGDHANIHHQWADPQPKCGACGQTFYSFTAFSTHRCGGVSAGETKPLTRCAAERDGECRHPQCPQLRDGEPLRSGRHCPLDAAVGARPEEGTGPNGVSATHIWGDAVFRPCKGCLCHRCTAERAFLLNLAKRYGYQEHECPIKPSELWDSARKLVEESRGR